MDETKIKEMLENNEIAVIYAEGKTEESAIELADTLTNVVGLAEFRDEDDNPVWGVLINKTKEIEVKQE